MNPEIEITPEMIEAGVDALTDHESWHLSEGIVEDVFRAMAAAQATSMENGQ